MRMITKTIAASMLKNRNRKKPRTSTEAKIAWKKFRGKQQTTLNCLKEQFGLCCYSEISLYNYYPIYDQTRNVSCDLGGHLEHIKPKSLFPQETFEHNNLILSAISSDSIGLLDKKDLFGGHAKGNEYDPISFISPLTPNTQKYFHYEISGTIVPKKQLSNEEKINAQLTIDILNLNAPILISWRSIWLTTLYQTLNTCSKDNIEAIANKCLLPKDNRLKPFHSAQRQILGKIGNKICLSHNL